MQHCKVDSNFEACSTRCRHVRSLIPQRCFGHRCVRLLPGFTSAKACVKQCFVLSQRFPSRLKKQSGTVRFLHTYCRSLVQGMYCSGSYALPSRNRLRVCDASVHCSGGRTQCTITRPVQRSTFRMPFKRQGTANAIAKACTNGQPVKHLIVEANGLSGLPSNWEVRASPKWSPPPLLAVPAHGRCFWFLSATRSIASHQNCSIVLRFLLLCGVWCDRHTALHALRGRNVFKHLPIPSENTVGVGHDSPRSCRSRSMKM